MLSHDTLHGESQFFILTQLPLVKGPNTHSKFGQIFPLSVEVGANTILVRAFPIYVSAFTDHHLLEECRQSLSHGKMKSTQCERIIWRELIEKVPFGPCAVVPVESTDRAISSNAEDKWSFLISSSVVGSCSHTHHTHSLSDLCFYWFTIFPVLKRWCKWKSEEYVYAYMGMKSMLMAGFRWKSRHSVQKREMVDMFLS